MKFTIKNYVQLDYGTTRTIKRFAWLPIKTDDGFIVFLEYYLINQEYKGKYHHKDIWRNIFIKSLI